MPVYIKTVYKCIDYTIDKIFEVMKDCILTKDAIDELKKQNEEIIKLLKN